MRLGLRMGLNSRQGGGSAIDPDARLYIAAVETALGTPIATALPSATSNPKRIISDFFKAEKAASRWTLHRRIYLPIYNNAAASAVDMVSRTSGTFQGLSGSVTHAAGYVQGDGVSGYFDTNHSPVTAGISLSTGSIYALIYAAATAGSKSHIAVSNGPTNTQYYGLASAAGGSIIAYTNADFSATSGYAGASLSTTSQTGIIFGSRFEGKSFIRRVTSSTNSLLTEEIETNTGAIPDRSIFAMGTNVAGTPGSFSNARYGSYGFGLGLSTEQSSGFSLNLKNLYESLTGLALP